MKLLGKAVGSMLQTIALFKEKGIYYARVKMPMGDAADHGFL